MANSKERMSVAKAKQLPEYNEHYRYADMISNHLKLSGGVVDPFPDNSLMAFYFMAKERFDYTDHMHQHNHWDKVLPCNFFALRPNQFLVENLVSIPPLEEAEKAIAKYMQIRAEHGKMAILMPLEMEWKLNPQYLDSLHYWGKAVVRNSTWYGKPMPLAWFIWGGHKRSKETWFLNK